MGEHVGAARRLNEDLGSKLTVAERLEGGLEFEPLAHADAIQKEFYLEPGFIGCVPFGSTTLGYGTHDSDFDIAILFDPSLFPGDTDKQCTSRIKEFSKTLKSSRTISCTPVPFLKSDVGGFVAAASLGLNFDFGLRFLCSQTAIGPRVEAYRKMLEEEIKKRSKDDQYGVIRKLAEIASEGEVASSGKVEKRTRGTVDMNLLKSQRRAMWEQQFKRAFKIEE